jgi:hypothetical protein
MDMTPETPNDRNIEATHLWNFVSLAKYGGFDCPICKKYLLKGEFFEHFTIHFEEVRNKARQQGYEKGWSDGRCDHTAWKEKWIQQGIEIGKKEKLSELEKEIMKQGGTPIQNFIEIAEKKAYEQGRKDDTVRKRKEILNEIEKRCEDDN